MRRRGAVCSAALALLGSGCGGDSVTTPPASKATGLFTGSNGMGLGIAVDFAGYDSTKRAIQAALGPDRAKWSVGIVSIVNRSADLVPVPILTATVPDGRMVRLEPATAARRAGAVVPLDDPGPYVPVQGAMTAYVTFQGRIDAIRRVQMRVGTGPPVELRAEEPARP